MPESSGLFLGLSLLLFGPDPGGLRESSEKWERSSVWGTFTWELGKVQCSLLSNIWLSLPLQGLCLEHPSCSNLLDKIIVILHGSIKRYLPSSSGRISSTCSHAISLLSSSEVGWLLRIVHTTQQRCSGACLLSSFVSCTSCNLIIRSRPSVRFRVFVLILFFGGARLLHGHSLCGSLSLVIKSMTTDDHWLGPLIH